METVLIDCYMDSFSVFGYNLYKCSSISRDLSNMKNTKLYSNNDFISIRCLNRINHVYTLQPELYRFRWVKDRHDSYIYRYCTTCNLVRCFVDTSNVFVLSVYRSIPVANQVCLQKKRVYGYAILCGMGYTIASRSNIF